MRYIYYGDEVLHDLRLGVVVDGGKLKQTINKVDSFTFTLPPTHPLLGKLESKQTHHEVRVVDGDETVFFGRIKDVKQNIDTSEVVTCEGEYAYLTDVMVKPYETGVSAPSAADGFFAWVVEQYNAYADADRAFEVGINQGAALDANNYIYRKDGSYSTAYSIISNKLCDDIGGYVRFRHEDGRRIIDWLADFPEQSEQRIEFGENLLDFARGVDSSDIANTVIPTGATPSDDNRDDDITPTPLDLSSLADGYTIHGYYKRGVRLINMDDVKRRGPIEVAEKWSDVTLVENLLANAANYLDGIVSDVESIEISAVDLSHVDPNTGPLKFGTYIRCTAAPVGFDSYLVCSERTMHIDHPEDDEYTLGQPIETLTGGTMAKVRSLNAQINTVYESTAAISDEAKAAATTATEASETAVQAAEEATKAQTAALSKKRVFTTIPTPPYDVGDLYTDGTDIYVCKTPREA